MAYPRSDTLAAISSRVMRIRPRRPAASAGSTGCRALSLRDEGRERALLAHPFRHPGSVLAGLESAHADLVAHLAVVPGHRDHVDVEAARRERPPHALRLAALLEGADLHRPVGLATLAGFRCGRL